MIWIAIVLFFGTISGSSLIAALGAFGIWLGTNIIGSILGVLADQGWILTYIPGTGNAGFVGGPSPLAVSVSTGTDGIGPNLINYILHPSWEVTYYKTNLAEVTPGMTPEQMLWVPLYSEPLSTVILTSITVALVHFTVFVATSSTSSDELK